MGFMKLDKKRFSDFFEVLSTYGEVHAPVKKRSNYFFEKVESPAELTLDYTRTMIPPKKYFIKTYEEMLRYRIDDSTFEPVPSKDEKLVLLGLHACDINALRILDNVFMSEPADPYYTARRKNTIIIGVSCMPDEYCFCKSMGTDYAWTGFDLFLHDIGHTYLVRRGSRKGEEIIKKLDKILEAPEPSDIEELKKRELERERKFVKKVNTSALPELIETLYESDVWKEYGERCLGCGSCNLVCPTCRCYETRDIVGLDMKEGRKVRFWYSCFMRLHGLVGKKEHFRPTRLDRFRHRYNCKSSIDEKTGLFNCVGCGRCSAYCPANIDHADVINRLWG